MPQQKRKSLEQLEEKYYGKRGTKKREEYEKSVKKEIHKLNKIAVITDISDSGVKIQLPLRRKKSK